MAKLKSGLILLFILTGLRAGFCQESFLAHHMSWNPVSLHSNPSILPDYDFYVGIPALSSVYLEYNNSLAFEDVFRYRIGDSLVLDMEYFVDNLRPRNNLDLATHEELFSIGMLFDPVFVHFTLAEKFRYRFAYPDDLIRFLWEGHKDFLGKELTFSRAGMELMAYSEAALGFSVPLMKELVIGARIKYLSGHAHLYGDLSDSRIYIDPETGHTNITSGFDMMAAGIINEVQDDIFVGYGKSSFTSKNPGYAFDISATFWSDSLLSISAGVLDLGSIYWKNGRRINVPEGDYTFDGIDFAEYFAGDRDTDEGLEEVVDTLKEIFNFTEEDKAYTRALRPVIFLSGNLYLTNSTMVSALIRGESFNGIFYPSFSLSAHHRIKRFLSVSLAYSVLNRSYTNFGAGLNVKLGPVQLYFLSDNLFGALSPETVRFYNMQFGMNLVFGDGQRKVKSQRSI